MITSPIRPRDRQESGVAAGGQLTHPRNALRRFTLVRDPDAPMASFRHALTEAPQRQNWPHRDRPVNSEPHPCLFSVGFPLSGPQVRTSTSDLIRHARHTRHSRYALGLRDDGRASPEPPRLPRPLPDPTALLATFLRDPYPPPTLTRGGPTHGVRSASLMTRPCVLDSTACLWLGSALQA